MKFPVIKDLVESFDLADLKKAADELENEKPLTVEIGGEDEGEKLTHVYGAIWILEEVENGKEKNLALREFFSRVRNSIN